MSKMKELSMTLDEIIEAGDELVASYEKAASAAKVILSELKDLKALLSGAPTRETVPEKAPEAEKTPEVEKQEVAKEPQPEVKTYSFTDVRGIMAGLAGQGKKSEAKALLTKFGAARLSEVKPEDYVALVEEAQVIANG